MSIICTSDDSSPVAVDPGIAFCSPSAAYAIACWPAGAGHALCLLNAAGRILVRYSVDGAFPPVPPSKDRAPFEMSLANGATCRIRDGGTGLNLTNHPNWIVWYYCDDKTAVFGPRDGNGVDSSSDEWTVFVASTGGEDNVTSVPVRTATFVGTAGG